MYLQRLKTESNFSKILVIDNTLFGELCKLIKILNRFFNYSDDLSFINGDYGDNGENDKGPWIDYYYLLIGLTFY